MFEILSSRWHKAQPIGMFISLGIHVVLVAWLLFSFRPTFVKVNSVAHGAASGSAKVTYFPASSFKILRTSAPLDWAAVMNPLKSGESKLALADKRKPTASRAQKAQILRTRANQSSKSRHGDEATPAGSPYGSLSSGTAIGLEIRPALWVSGFDPTLNSSDLRGMNDTMIVEITIDERGNIVNKTVLHSLGAEIDSRVLAALESWHFLPARRDGVAIASKQDVHFHFGKERS